MTSTPAADPVVEQLRQNHWLVFDLPLNIGGCVTGCHCGFEADMDSDVGYGDSVTVHLFQVAVDAARAALPRCGDRQTGLVITGPAGPSTPVLVCDLASGHPGDMHSMDQGDGLPPVRWTTVPLFTDPPPPAECCASGRCEVCHPGYGQQYIQDSQR